MTFAAPVTTAPMQRAVPIWSRARWSASTDRRTRASHAPPMPSKYHQGTPFCAQITGVPGPSIGRIAWVAAPIACALVARVAGSCGPAASGVAGQAGRATNSPPRSTTRTPFAHRREMIAASDQRHVVTGAREHRAGRGAGGSRRLRTPRSSQLVEQGCAQVALGEGRQRGDNHLVRHLRPRRDLDRRRQRRAGEMPPGRPSSRAASRAMAKQFVVARPSPPRRSRSHATFSGMNPAPMP